MTRATKHVTFHLTSNSHKELSKKAKLAQLGIGQYVSQIVIEYLRNKRKEGKEQEVVIEEESLGSLTPEEIKWFKQNIVPYFKKEQQRRNETIEAMFSTSGPTIKSGSYDVFKATRDLVDRSKQEKTNGERGIQSDESSSTCNRVERGTTEGS